MRTNLLISLNDESKNMNMCASMSMGVSNEYVSLCNSTNQKINKSKCLDERISMSVFISKNVVLGFKLRVSNVDKPACDNNV